MAAAFNGRVIEMIGKESRNSWIQLGLHDDELGAKETGVFDVDHHTPMNWSFYFVRHRPYCDPKMKEKLDAADKEIQTSNYSRIQIMDDLRANRAKREDLFARLNFLKSKRNWTNAILDEKKKQLEPFEEAHSKLHTPVGSPCGKAPCSPENELNDLICGLEYRIKHKVKQVAGTRERVAATVAKTRDFQGQKEFIQDQIMDVDMGSRKDLQALDTKIYHLGKQLDEKIVEIEFLESELEFVTDKREKACESIQALRRQRDEGNATYYQSRCLLAKARELAAHRRIKDLEDLSHPEVEKFMWHWNCNKKFRVDYEKRILASLDARQLSRDGRVRYPHEEEPWAVETEPARKDISGRGKENYPECHDALTKKAEKETAKRVVNSFKTSSGQSDISESDIPCCEKPGKEEKIEEARLNEMKREEEMEKARRAMERKRKLQEKAAAKAAIRAQKEVEKKLKEREKKSKKKAAANSSSLYPEKPPAKEVTETSKLEMVKRKVQVLVKEITDRVIRRERSCRFRKQKNDAKFLRKAIIRRRKLEIYWDLALSGARVALVLFMVPMFFHALWLVISKWCSAGILRR